MLMTVIPDVAKIVAGSLVRSMVLNMLWQKCCRQQP